MGAYIILNITETPAGFYGAVAGSGTARAVLQVKPGGGAVI